MTRPLWVYPKGFDPEWLDLSGEKPNEVKEECNSAERRGGAEIDASREKGHQCKEEKEEERSPTAGWSPLCPGKDGQRPMIGEDHDPEMREMELEAEEANRLDGWSLMLVPLCAVIVLFMAVFFGAPMLDYTITWWKLLLWMS